MKLSRVVLKLRLQNTRFKEKIAGAAELAVAMANTLPEETAFVVPLSESCPPNKYDGSINQTITERFGVVVALRNDVLKPDKTGVTAFDSLDTVRTQIFKGILNWKMDGVDSHVCYVGGSLLDMNPAWLWYQFEFETYRYIDDDDGVDEGYTDDFEQLYTQWETWPSINLPYTGDLPATSFTPDMTSIVDTDDDPYIGSYDRAFNYEFDWYPKNDPWYT